MRAAEQICIFTGSLPSWVLNPGGVFPAIDIDFANGRAWTQAGGLVLPASLLTVTRASQETITGSAGNLTYAPNGSGTAGIGAALSNAGLQVFEARTNVVLWNNDLTNAAWTASSITAAKDQTGPDGVANSASSILATAGNGTILQGITLSSAAAFQSAYVKRLIGTGVVNMTMDNGVTWAAVTVTSAWTRVSIPTQTLANPTVGFQIVTNGDKIAVALVQNENGTFATPAIPTTSGSAARAADVITLTNPPTFGSVFTLVAWGTPSAPTNYGTNQVAAQIDTGSDANRLSERRNSATFGTGTSTAAYEVASSETDLTPTGTWAQFVSGKVASSGRNGAQFAAFNSGTVVSASAAGSVTPTTVRIGSNSSGAAQWDGTLSRIALWPTTALSAGALQQVTT
jgi:hypothetical protein